MPRRKKRKKGKCISTLTFSSMIREKEGYLTS